ncbi:uncharacterized protein ARB_00527 [Trichophyton benhamiae CBS 112371]|uniref:PWI domain-containing protein n=1 Tax=Arthroderma benhamiae (strain ATCC MYA-4681 / CBS 112371) TaxID=663331 RepID=D4AWG2_ARTBC|nr:uncharacterized protein ARB_00527 [Trichophyton benhamiae CBS 112371]EFE32702.1 hypothetical protein ARB_00527 [Trichophyton benhamiae CBS 112371]
MEQWPFDKKGITMEKADSSSPEIRAKKIFACGFSQKQGGCFDLSMFCSFDSRNFGSMADLVSLEWDIENSRSFVSPPLTWNRWNWVDGSNPFPWRIPKSAKRQQKDNHRDKQQRRRDRSEKELQRRRQRAAIMDAKLLKTTKFPPEFAKKVDMTKVNIEVMKKWIAERISDILGNEDDVVIELCFNLLEGSRFVRGQTDSRLLVSLLRVEFDGLTINLTGFLEKDTAKFCKDLWNLCLSAQDSPQGVPKELLEAKKLELMQEQRESGGERERIVAVAEEAAVALLVELIGTTAEILPRLIDGDEAHRFTEIHLAGEQISTFPAVVEAIDEMIIEGAARRDSPLLRRPGHHHALSRQFGTVDGIGGLPKEGGGVRPAALAHLIEVTVTVTVTVAGNEPAARPMMTTPGPQAARRPEEDGEDREAEALSLHPLLVIGLRDPVVHLHHDLRRGQVARVIGEVGALGGDPLCTNKGLDVMYLELILLKIAEVTTTAGLAAAVAAVAAAVAIEREAGVEAAEDTAEDSGRPAAGHRRAAHVAAAAAAAAVAGGGINLLKDMPQLDAGRARTVLPLHHLLKSDRE